MATLTGYIALRNAPEQLPEPESVHSRVYIVENIAGNQINRRIKRIGATTCRLVMLMCSKSSRASAWHVFLISNIIVHVFFWTFV